MFLKRFFLLFVVTTFLLESLTSQVKKDYAISWNKVEEFEKKGLTKSALQEVMRIYNLARKENNDAQQIKSSIYQVKYRQMVEEDSRENNIFYLDTLIAAAKPPAKNILQSIQAQMFWQYLQNNRYKFYNRTKLAEEKSKDIATWSLEKLHATISHLYTASLSNDELLKATRIDHFDAIIIKGENTRQLRPTLFDFLAHRALSYLMNDERDLIKPAYHFTIRDTMAFAPANEFAQATFAAKDSTSLHHKAILLLQQITRFHLKDKLADALLDVEFTRLNFVYQYSINENKKDLFENALKQVEETYGNNPGVAQAMYLRARLYQEKGQQFVPLTNTLYQYEVKRAKALCEIAIKKYPGSEGAINCQNLLNQVIQPSLMLETEKVNIPNQPFRTLVKYKNVRTLYFRLIQTSREGLKKMDRRNYDKIWKDIVGLRPVKNWSVTLPDLQDYQNHAAEIKVDALGSGTYFLLASIDENFSLNNNIIARQLVYVSNISYIHNNSNEYYVLHRDNGQPLPNTFVQVWNNKYNYNKNENDAVKAESYTTDKNGMFRLKESKEYRNFTMQFQTKDEELFLDENNYNNNYNSIEPQPSPLTFLFTDRSIYRPGQTVYFKGIVLKKGLKANQTAILPSFTSSLLLKDANGEKLNELKLQTNEFGSYHGSFKLPEGLLNGQFSLFDENTNATQFFYVEEYKRPKFFVDVKKPAGTYRVLDSIKVTGVAKAYAGNDISGAAVKFRVVRKVRYQPWWRDFAHGYASKIMPPRRSEEMEITNGETTTDSKGEFHITFKALPDESIAKNDQPVFHYEVSADITDLNGETRTGNTLVAVAYQLLQLEIKTAEKMPVDSLKQLLVKSTNLNDIEETTLTTVTIQKLVGPGKVFRERYWDQPDQFVMSRDEYYSYFPHDVYKDENELKNYLPGEKILQKADSSNRTWQVDNKGLKAGWYKIIATAKDKYGEEVRTEKYIQLTGNDGGMPISEPIIVEVKKAGVEPGEKINYSIKSGFNNIWLIQTINKMEGGTLTSYNAIKATQPYLNKIDVQDRDRGGMALGYAFVQHNRVYKGAENIDVPWSNKDLLITYETFREKILPGSKERWTVKVSGNKGEKVAAEMLAAMYDASLDQFKPHNWSALDIWPSLYKVVTWAENGFLAANSEEYNKKEYPYLNTKPKSYDHLLEFDNGLNDVVVRGYSGTGKRLAGRAPGMIADESSNQDLSLAVQKAAPAPREEKAEESISDTTKEQQASTSVQSNPAVQIRKNFNETAFFLPDLKTDAEGNVSFDFTIPEALTQWKLLTLAHTKELANGYLEKSVITQKPLMVQPNAPRFMREGDQMEFSAEVVNLSDKEITGTAQLELIDAATNNPVDGWFKNVFANQYFTVGAGQTAAVKFPIEIPFNFNSALSYRIVAKSAAFSDGEEMILPVLTNRMLVTESLPVDLRNTNTKNFKFEKLLNSGSSTTIKHHAFTVEYASNPTWYAVQALPYLMESPHDCADEVFNRYYANTLAQYITHAIPRIKAVFDKWKIQDTAALLSNLQKNEELKSVLLQETPWVLEAKNERLQKQQVALLFDIVRMSSEAGKSINKLKEAQSPNGGFVWFKGGPDDRYITQYIITGIGHLKKMNALNVADGKQLGELNAIVNKAIPYLDKKIREEYDDLLRYKADLKKNNLSNSAIQYLYMRSFFPGQQITPFAKIALNYYTAQAKKYWLQHNKYMQAMIALALHRGNDPTTPVNIIRSLKENSIKHEEMGMYWKEWTNGGYYWHQAPVESQALMIEAFTDIDKNKSTIDDLKTWLLKQKQTQNWRTTRATAEACYALLLGGNNWLTENNEVTIMVGHTAIKSTDSSAEEGTGYFKKRIEGSAVQPGMGNISVALKASGAKTATSGSWGAVHWQYFEDLDKITTAATPLKLGKQLFIERNSDTGPQLEAINGEQSLRVGDKVKVRIELKVDRDMEYIHMKDMRAACMEPVNVLSGYKYQGGLGYYESTLDASTNFFFNALKRGTYIFEYNLFVTLPGNFSSGIATIQSMYAPEFNSHSEGVRVRVEGGEDNPGTK